MGRGGGSAARPSYTVTTTDLETGKRVWETKTESENLLRPPSVVFSPNGAQLALVTQDKDQTAIKVFDTATRREVSDVRPPRGRTSTAWSSAATASGSR